MRLYLKGAHHPSISLWSSSTTGRRPACKAFSCVSKVFPVAGSGAPFKGKRGAIMK